MKHKIQEPIYSKSNSGERRRSRVESERETRTTASTPVSCACNPRNSAAPSAYTYY